MKVFEVDYPSTQAVMMEKIKEIFGRLRDHVFYVPVDLATEDLGQRLLAKGYDSEDYKKAYFHEANEGRAVCSLMSFVNAVVE